MIPLYGNRPCLVRQSAMQRLTASSARACHLLRRQPRGTVTCHAQKVSELPSNLKKIVGAFQMVPDPMARYKQLLFFATKLAPMPAEDHTPSNKVEGCVSQVWVVPELRDDDKIYWRADSDSQLTKGLAALLVTGLSGCTPAEILSVQPDFIEALGLKQSLTPSRNNGFLNMFRLMQRKTLGLVAAQAQAAAQVPDAAYSSDAPAPTANGNGSEPTYCAADLAAAGGTPAAPASASAETAPVPKEDATAAPSSTPPLADTTSTTSDTTSTTPIQDSIRCKLRATLQPTHLLVCNESCNHHGHGDHGHGDRPGEAGTTGETHLRVEVVSEAFQGMTLVKRQRMIYQLLDEEFKLGLHMLVMVTKTPAEAEKAASTAR